MDVNNVFKEWLQSAKDAPDLIEELKNLNPLKDAKEIYDRFYTDL